MTLVDPTVDPEALTNFLLKLEGFQVTEQLEDHIAIIVYSMEPAILSSDSQWNQAVAPERLIAREAPGLFAHNGNSLYEQMTSQAGWRINYRSRSGQ